MEKNTKDTPKTFDDIMRHIANVPRTKDLKDMRPQKIERPDQLYIKNIRNTGEEE